MIKVIATLMRAMTLDEGDRHTDEGDDSLGGGWPHVVVITKLCSSVVSVLNVTAFTIAYCVNYATLSYRC